jgi:hypothetical protein
MSKSGKTGVVQVANEDEVQSDSGDAESLEIYSLGLYVLVENLCNIQCVREAILSRPEKRYVLILG